MALFGFGKKSEGRAPSMGPPGAPPSYGPPTAQMPYGPPGMGDENPPLPVAEQGPPVDQVMGMRQQGLTNNQLIQNLQRAGYSQQQIFDAMNQADIKSGIEASPLGGYEQPQAGMEPLPPYGQESPYGPEHGLPPMGPPGEEMPPMGGPMGSSMQQMQGGQRLATPMGVSEEKMEEIAESIIEEKWTDFVSNINKIIEWKDKMEARIDSFDQKLKDIQDEYEKLHTAILGKISEYDKNILSVGTEVKAMEKVFQKILPEFTENINELNRVTQRMKGK